MKICVRHSGFTLIELIVVIVLLGALSVLLAPSLINIKDDAEKASVQAFMQGFRTAANLANQKWLVNGQPASLVIGGTPVTINNEGYPMPVPRSPQGCADIWTAIQTAAPSITLMQAGVSAEGWTVSTFSQSCIFAYQNGDVFNNAITPFFSYNPISLPEGSPNPTVNAGTITGFNLD